MADHDLHPPGLNRTLQNIFDLGEGETLLLHLPERDITYHHVRRTADGFETCTTLTDWRSISTERLIDELGDEHRHADS